jgi:glycosyltransferase involved in cell wall biosynthesis
MRILMAMHSLAMGGAEKFFVNLANALHQRHEVTCYIPALACGHLSMINRLGTVPTVSIPGFTPFGYKVFYKLVLIAQKRFHHFNPESTLHSRVLRSLHRRKHFDIVNAQLMEGTRQVCTAFKDIPLPITESDHGDFAMVNPAAPLHNTIIFQRLDALICPAQSNIEKSRLYPWQDKLRIASIPYGYLPSKPSPSPPSPAPDVFTFGMVARGIREKGWLEALAAFRLVKTQLSMPARLVFVGDGPCLDQIKHQLTDSDHPSVLLVGPQNDPESWIRTFDVGLLPTFMPGESLPNSIIEYLACGKPVIATRFAGIPEMLATPEGDAGILTSLTPDGVADTPSLAAAMLQLASDPTLLRTFASRTSLAFSKFSMPACVASYESLFQELIDRP